MMSYFSRIKETAVNTVQFYNKETSVVFHIYYSLHPQQLHLSISLPGQKKNNPSIVKEKCKQLEKQNVCTTLRISLLCNQHYLLNFDITSFPIFGRCLTELFNTPVIIFAIVINDLCNFQAINFPGIFRTVLFVSFAR